MNLNDSERLPWCDSNDRETVTGGVLKKLVLKNFVKFIGKHLCQSHFLNNAAGLSPEQGNCLGDSNCFYMPGCDASKFKLFVEKILFFIALFK